jgi:hypothetical protein
MTCRSKSHQHVKSNRPLRDRHTLQKRHMDSTERGFSWGGPATARRGRSTGASATFRSFPSVSYVTKTISVVAILWIQLSYHRWKKLAALSFRCGLILAISSRSVWVSRLRLVTRGAAEPRSSQSSIISLYPSYTTYCRCGACCLVSSTHCRRSIFGVTINVLYRYTACQYLGKLR